MARIKDLAQKLDFKTQELEKFKNGQGTKEHELLKQLDIANANLVQKNADFQQL